MNKLAWLQFMQDDQGRYSSTRLAVLVAVIGLVVVLIILAIKGITDGGTATALAGLAGGSFVGGKMSSDSVTKATTTTLPDGGKVATTDQITKTSVTTKSKASRGARE